MFSDYLVSLILLAAFVAVLIITFFHGRFVKKQSEKTQRQLLVALAHDMGTPLTVIKGYTEGLMDGVADTEEKQSAYLKQIYGRTVEMDRLLSDMMLYVRATSDGIRYEMERFDLALAIEDFVSAAGHDFTLRNAEVSFINETGGPVFIKGDKSQLIRVMENLIENSVKYKRGDKVNITIRLYSEAAAMKLSVTDDGRGIKAEELPYIFDDMYRGSQKKGSVRGSGVGLWLVKRIVTDHGGSIWAESEYGTYTTIGVTFEADREST